MSSDSTLSLFAAREPPASSSKLLPYSVGSAADSPGNSSASLLPSHPFDLSGRVVLLAVDDVAGADDGAHIALALARSRHALIHVVHVEDPDSSPASAPLRERQGGCDAVATSSVSRQQPLSVQASLGAVLNHTIDWPVRIMTGTPAKAITEEARRIGAVLIVVGLQRHGRVHRALHGETVLTVMRDAACPVLAVVPGMTELPERVLAAVDFSETSLLAARAAGALMRDEGFLVLAYVAALTGLSPDDGERTVHDLGVQAGFARTAETLKREGITFDHVVLHHELPRSPAEMLLEYAYATRTDMIAAGSVRREHVERPMMGSVSAELVRNGTQSLLIVPPRARSILR